ncbi:MAG TPA: hypothetical protein VLT16_09945 [Candidatus Limnocylindrales bacterium]|nr:hypothetical protein [Candidatus Limnocylindrales bacterium]
MRARKTLPSIRVPRTRHARLQLKGGERPHSHHSRGDHPERTFNAGDPVSETGIYEVVHDRGHRDAHEVVMLNGDSFPPCDTCEKRVRFRLIRTAPYIFQDQDFEEA